METKPAPAAAAPSPTPEPSRIYTWLQRFATVGGWLGWLIKWLLKIIWWISTWILPFIWWLTKNVMAVTLFAIIAFIVWLVNKIKNSYGGHRTEK